MRAVLQKASWTPRMNRADCGPECRCYARPSVPVKEPVHEEASRTTFKTCAPECLGYERNDAISNLGRDELCSCEASGMPLVTPHLNFGVDSGNIGAHVHQMLPTSEQSI